MPEDEEEKTEFPPSSLPQVGVPPAPRRREEVRRSWRSLGPQTRIALAYLLPLVIVGGVALQAVIRDVGWSIAFDIAIGAVSASQAHAGAWGMVLAGVGYLFLPALASLMIASLWTGPSRR